MASCRRPSDFKYGGCHAAVNEGVLQVMDETFKAPFDLLLGRKTYDIFAAYWPRVAADPSLVNGHELTLGIAKGFDNATKYVATHSPGRRWSHRAERGRSVGATGTDCMKTTPSFTAVTPVVVSG